MRRGAVLLFGFLCACSAILPSWRDTSVPMRTVAAFEVGRYAGTWYEVARYPAPFQSGCLRSSATYSLLGGGEIGVRNACRTENGWRVINGTARVVGPGRLSVRLDGVPVAADYRVLWVDEGYRTAVVGTPSGRSGWILNRSPEIPADRLAAAREVLAFNGYDLAGLMTTGEVAQ